MSLVPRQTRTSAPFSGGTNGLPSDTFGSRLFPLAGGSFMAQRAAGVASAQDRDIATLGVVMTPGMTLVDAISLASDLKGASGRIFVGEGVWDFGDAGVTIATSGLEIISLSPGKTYFRRMGTPTGAMLTITGANTRIEGITFYDSNGSQDTIDVQADNVSIERCVFADVYQAIHATASTSGLVVWSNRVDANRTSRWLSIEAACMLARVIGNTILAANQELRASDAGVTHSSFVNNIHAATGIVSINPNGGNVAAANVPEALIAASYSLADNTAVAVDVTGFPTWDVTVYRSVHMRYQISRGATPNIEAGELVVVMNSAECIAYVDAVTTTTAPGVTLSGAVSGGVAKLQYTTTATGSAATLLILSVTYGVV